METQTNPLHLCPEINVIRCMLNFDKHEKVSHKSKCKAPPLTLGLPQCWFLLLGWVWGYSF